MIPPTYKPKKKFMPLAIAEAKRARDRGDYAIGAVILGKHGLPPGDRDKSRTRVRVAHPSLGLRRERSEALPPTTGASVHGTPSCPPVLTGIAQRNREGPK